MVFSSSIFLFVFLPIVLAGYYLINPRFRNVFLLISSLLFYAWGEPKFVLVMLASILINYTSAILIAKTNNLPKKLFLALGIVLNLAILFSFKYLDFAINTVNDVFSTDLALYKIALPIGISFFTFQGLTYIIDLYRGVVDVQKNPIKVALYISLFPQLIAGPIVRYKDVNEQINSREHSSDLFYSGVARFSMGLAKKVIIANEMGRIADMIFANPVSEITPLIAWIGILAYAFQIYFDFSGYSDMAIGLGRMFGFKFLENFNYPYIAKSITDFWRRWHISLSTFFRDYVYIPLGGNRTGNIYFNLIVVFFLTGLWHGAAWNFVVWGLWHGMFLMIEKFLFKQKTSFGIFGYAYTFLVVILGWVFFRSPDLSYALDFIAMMFGFEQTKALYYYASYYVDSYAIFVFALSFVLSWGLFNPACDSFQATKLKLQAFFNQAPKAKEAILGVMLLLLFVYSGMGVMEESYNPFIYFRF